uniref:peptidoglycan DD-metalloendopeptidase family protein n=1 Tax=uncultured Sphingomonas sp. TaxID=158754 RepID=UPI0035CA00E5
MHTDVRNISDGHGHHHYVYGEGGSTGQTAREHAANPNQPHNWQSQNGADIICPRGTPIYAAFDGNISDKFGVEHGHENDTVQSTHHGNRLIIVGANNQAFYQHLDRIADGVVSGATVHRGELIGYSGIGGGVEHLHFAVQHGDTDSLLHDAAAQASHAETSTATPNSAAAHANDVPAPAGHSTSQHDGETTAANITSGHQLNPGVEPGPANGRFNTGEDFRHSGNLHSLQLHPEMLHGDGRAGDNATTARHSDGIRSDPGRDDGSAWSISGRHEDQSASAASSGSHQNGTAAAPEIQGHGGAPHAGITSDPGHHDVSAVSHHAHHGHDPAVQHSGQPETAAVGHTSHDWDTTEAGRIASDPGHHDGGAIAHASDGHQSTGYGRIASDPGHHEGGVISHSSNGHHASSDGRVTSDPGHHTATISSNPGDHNDQGAVASHPGPLHEAVGASHSGHHDSHGHHEGAATSHTHQDHEAAAAHHG